MADNEGGTPLKDSALMRLAENISSSDMETIALKHFDIGAPRIRNMRDRGGNSEAFNFAILEKWKNSHWGPNQRQVRFNNSFNNKKINMRIHRCC